MEYLDLLLARGERYQDLASRIGGCDHGRDRYIADRALAANEPVWVDGFGGRGPGESPGLALRTAEIAAPAASARRMLAFVRTQRSPYLATRADLTPGPTDTC
jgi:hypothetical protein